MGRILLIILGVLALLVGLLFVFSDDIVRVALAPQELTEGVVAGVQLDEIPDDSIEIVAENLKVPWGIEFLPDGDLLVTERPGTLKRIGANGATYEIEGVVHVAEGGLMGIALHPDYEANHWIYLYFTTRIDNALSNRIERYVLENNILREREVLLAGIPGAIFHDGGRMHFGPDGYLYVTTGEANMGEIAQDLDSLAGKILRMTDQGAIPPDNPSGTLVYTSGHRNPQGITWDDDGNLWSTEHGPSGVASGLDEINLIEPGNNYGWPTSRGDEVEAGTTGPVLHSGEDYTWAPASAAYWDGSLFFGGLRGSALYEARRLETNSPRLIAHLYLDFGRIRTVKLGPDGWLYITTSNTDGRGVPNEGDDMLLKIDPSVFRE